MTVLAPARAGWCPGTLRPMESGDGLVVRVKPRGGVLPLHTAAMIAEVAVRHGNGDLDLTSRANLQIRGVTEASLQPVIHGLDALGLVDVDAGAEAVRNVVASPLAGLDPHARVDIRPIVAALEDALAAQPLLWRLPAKWSFVVDDRGLFDLGSVAADLRFEAAADGSILVGLGRDRLRAACRPDDVVAVAVAVCLAALQSGPKRMDDILRERGAAALFAAADLTPAGVATAQHRGTAAQDLVGWLPFGRAGALGVAPPFGALRAEHLLDLTRTAHAAGATELRLTPWRVVLVPVSETSRAAGIAAALQGTPWIVEARDPRLAVAACSGAPACRRATTPVRADALRLARNMAGHAMQTGIAVHVSGCAKGCAHAGVAPWTLVGQDGAYALVRNGKAGDAPLGRDLTLSQAMARISAAGEAEAA